MSVPADLNTAAIEWQTDVNVLAAKKTTRDQRRATVVEQEAEIAHLHAILDGAS